MSFTTTVVGYGVINGYGPSSRCRHDRCEVTVTRRWHPTRGWTDAYVSRCDECREDLNNGADRPFWYSSPSVIGVDRDTFDRLGHVRLLHMHRVDQATMEIREGGGSVTRETHSAARP